MTAPEPTRSRAFPPRRAACREGDLLHPRLLHPAESGRLHAPGGSAVPVRNYASLPSQSLDFGSRLWQCPPSRRQV
eukprot:9870416-Heterocapsa_arctica.AAC.1